MVIFDEPYTRVNYKDSSGVMTRPFSSSISSLIDIQISTYENVSEDEESFPSRMNVRHF